EANEFGNDFWSGIGLHRVADPRVRQRGSQLLVAAAHLRQIQDKTRRFGRVSLEILPDRFRRGSVNCSCGAARAVRHTEGGGQVGQSRYLRLKRRGGFANRRTLSAEHRATKYDTAPSGEFRTTHRTPPLTANRV